MTRSEFLQRRKSGIGGSDAAAVMGLSRYRTPMDVFKEKTGDAADDQRSDVLELASYLEDYTARKWAEQTGYGIRRKNTECVHPEYAFIKGNIDRQITGDAERGSGVLECKALSTYNFRNVEAHGLPDEYVIQMQHYFACGGFRWGAFAILNRDTGRLLTFEVVPDAELIERIVTACVSFWTQCVIPLIPPTEVKPERVSLPKYDGKISDLEADDNLAAMLADYDELATLAAEASGLVEECKERIKTHLGEIQAAECRGYRVYYNTAKPRETIDAAKLKKEAPEVYEKYRKQSEASRTFRFYNINKGN